ncbi:MAG: hypothetical protein M3Z04_24580 [Chloroflexota bacterium]|nr:hypothetical protein [Chloroflexota bacterium]
MAMESSPLEEWFPNLATAGYVITSPVRLMYNCYAWAAGENAHWWEPGRVMTHYYWPPDLLPANTLEIHIQLFVIIGFVACEDSKLEAGFEKVALYAHANGTASHAARQLASGVWTSKLGIYEDITHNTLEALEGDVYGTVAQILRRPHSNTP